MYLSGRFKMRTKVSASLATMVALVGLWRPAFCGDTTGVITEFLLLSDIPDILFVRVTGTNSNPLSCSVLNNRYVLDTSTSTGKQIYTALLAAKHANVAITLHGLGNCNLYSNSETLRGI